MKTVPSCASRRGRIEHSLLVDSVAVNDHMIYVTTLFLVHSACIIKLNRELVSDQLAVIGLGAVYHVESSKRLQYRPLKRLLMQHALLRSQIPDHHRLLLGVYETHK